MSEAKEHRFPCDQCGADLRFDPSKGQLSCDFCGNSEPLVEHYRPAPITEQDFHKALRAELSAGEMEETRVLSCTNCGAQVEFEPDVHAAECPFCATPVVTDTGAHRHIKPKGLLPFALEEKDAKAAMNTWLGRLWFAPNSLQKYARKGRKMQGIYVPYWTYDANTRSQYEGQRGTVYYETRTVVRNGQRQTQRVQRVRWRGVRGRVGRAFDDVLVLASRSLPKRFTDALEPWDMSRLEPYSPEYLAGFRAEGYTVSLEDGFDEARHMMDRVIERDVKFDIGGDRQRITALQTQVSDVTFKHVLLPVWLAAYKYRGRTFRFVVNGRTGQVQGERPYSAWKIFFAALLVAIFAACAGYLYAVNEGLVQLP
ncbi:TFIIB-type zinc finger domain-containing protein [Nereida sp. MMG025]|uniref:TFIIB-type zinc finger domain-containing protein n=1 Tax=Nereida sp. MMG025 TaxID=2909981 RepID=UPI001F2519A0|nr:TFIIB-type zinc finger domain-containing protein [Nereida sp. MMG025]MCF6443966.1 TFIIB-type zinc finger domain-containing protein [Nereida sp. MMG025]